MRLLSVTSLRDEGPFLLEWLAWHRLIGVSDFWIASNDCSDGSDHLLALLDRAGVITHHPHRPDPRKSIQWQALRAAWAHPLRKSADWMLISDLDEFPVIHTGRHHFADLIAALPEGTEALSLAWRLFGASGHLSFEDRPVTQSFTRCAPAAMFEPIAATFFKSLFRPQAFAKPGVHRPLTKEGASGARWADGAGRPLAAPYSEDKRLSLLGLQDHRQLAEMHHYSLRSVESFIVKAARGLPNRASKPIDLSYWVERNFNSERNEAALALAAPLAEEIARLRALPGVAEAHEACVFAHRAAFRRLIRNESSYRLWVSCLHAADSAALPPPVARLILERFQLLETQAPQQGSKTGPG